MTAYVTLAELLYLAERALGIDAAILEKGARIQLAESALQAPAAGFGDTEFYPDLTDKVAVLGAHFVWNHPLPDGNKRTAWLAVRLFVERNGGTWLSRDEADDMMVALAAHDIDEHEFADWLRSVICWD